MEFWNNDVSIMQNTGNFSHFYIARFEASSKYIKMPSYKNIVTHTFKVCKYLKIKMETHYVMCLRLVTKILNKKSSTKKLSHSIFLQYFMIFNSRYYSLLGTKKIFEKPIYTSSGGGPVHNRVPIHAHP